MLAQKIRGYPCGFDGFLGQALLFHVCTPLNCGAWTIFVCVFLCFLCQEEGQCEVMVHFGAESVGVNASVWSGMRPRVVE